MPGSVIAVVLAIRGPLLHPFFRGLRAPLLPVLDHLDADRRYRPRPDFRYEVTTHGSGAGEALKVKQSAASTATVHLTRDGDGTVFHIHGGGLVISRMVNEFGIAKKAAEAITEAFGGRS
jgi:hypothetical protein